MKGRHIQVINFVDGCKQHTFIGFVAPKEG